MNETFGQRFYRLRKQFNFTQEEIANKLNVTSQAVSKWENDVSSPDITLLAEISDIFNITIDELLGKNNKKVEIVPLEQRDEIDSMVLRINILSTDGDKVKVNLPIALVRACINSNASMPSISGNDSLKNINFKEILNLVEQGVVGELVNVESADGDTITITVEKI